MILLLVLAACAVQVPQDTVKEMPCTLDARICQDGSAVGRNGTNNCEFDACPAVVKNKCAEDTKDCGNGIVVSRNYDKGCEFDACPFQVDQNFESYYRDGKVSYTAKITKPTPCHKLNVTEQILESYPVQIRIDVEKINPPANTFCAQVLDDEIISGGIILDHKPGSLTVFYEGIVLYSEKEFK